MKSTISILLVVLLFCGTSLGADVKDFSLRDLDGELVKLSDYLGKGPVILDFWSTWCKPCVKVLPKIQEMYDEYSENGLVVLGINQDGPRSLSKVAPFSNLLGLTFPVLLDKDQEVVRKYQVSGFPTTILLDKEGNVVETIRGYRPGDEARLKEKVAELLRGDQK
jgi:cytochrome c biogenesis protein CcmG, thiol:disulfide interchange protein DsbE